MAAQKLEISKKFGTNRKSLFKLEDDSSSSSDSDTMETLFPEKQHSAIIQPIPGICVKTKNKQTGEKAFINICTSKTVPAPEDITNDELLNIFSSDSPSSFKIPMSIGQPHNEKDNSGNLCLAYEVVIHPSFLSKISDDTLFHNFFMIVTLEGLEEKYGIILDKNSWIVLKNKKYHGNMPTQFVKTEMPFIQELSKAKSQENQRNKQTNSKTNRNQESQKKKIVPFENPKKDNTPLLKEVSTKKCKKTPNSFTKKLCYVRSKKVLHLELILPEVSDGNEIGVRIGPNGIEVSTKLKKVVESFYHPLDALGSEAFFAQDTKELVIRIPLIMDKEN